MEPLYLPVKIRFIECAFESSVKCNFGFSKKIKRTERSCDHKGRNCKNNRRDEVSFELKAAEIQEIPVEGRDITRVLFRLPNVSQATGFFPESPNVSINGASSLYTSYLIDGLDNNERFLGGQNFAIPSGFVKMLPC
jgi:hypothetical protein